MVPAIIRQRPRTHDPTPRSSSRPAVEIARDRVATRAPAPLRSILVPLDFTPPSDRVLARVAQLSLAHDARVALLHVIPGDLALRATQRAMHEAGKSLALEAWHLRRHLRRKVRIETRVRVGTAAVQIADEAAAIDADLIVMGRGGGHPLRTPSWARPPSASSDARRGRCWPCANARGVRTTIRRSRSRSTRLLRAP